MDDSRIELRRHTESSLRFGGEMGMVGGNEGAEARDAPRSTRDPGSRAAHRTRLRRLDGTFRRVLYPSPFQVRDEI